jgi:hypothetical protein
MCFADQLHRNVEAYVDDGVIKTRSPDDLIADLEETFSSLRRFRWKLNPTKFSGLEVHHVLREHNIGADVLSNLGSTRAQVSAGVFIQKLKQPSIKPSPQVTTDAGLQQPDWEVMLLGEDWREAYIRDGCKKRRGSSCHAQK